MEKKNQQENQNQNQIQIELSEEMSQGHYSNLAIVAHSQSEFVIDFINIVPGAPKARVNDRVILTPDNARRLLFALQDNIRKYEEMMKNGGHVTPFGENYIPTIVGKPGQA
ncbi:MAG: DUF3467 domain-containing protein [Tannerella sp.]|jgi:hypothetical protein|nr:DUF3467 domain-containing protein [Tannerella sp.]